MKRFWHKIKRIVHACLWMTLGVLFIVILSSSIKHQNEIVCNEVLVMIDYSSGNQFIDEADVLETATVGSRNPLIGKNLKELGLSEVEGSLQANPYIEHAEVYTNLNGSVIMQIIQKQPILRIINNRGVSFYLSDKGEHIPLSDKFTPRLAVATGSIRSEFDNAETTDSILLINLRTLQLFIRSDEFWQAAIEQIYVKENYEIELIPKIGNHTILLGPIDENMENNFEKLKLFYEDGIRTVGWDQYKTINLKYKDQIVCTKY